MTRGRGGGCGLGADALVLLFKKRSSTKHTVGTPFGDFVGLRASLVGYD